MATPSRCRRRRSRSRPRSGRRSRPRPRRPSRRRRRRLRPAPPRLRSRPVAEDRDPALEQALLVLGVVLEVLRDRRTRARSRSPAISARLGPRARPVRRQCLALSRGHRFCAALGHRRSLAETQPVRARRTPTVPRPAASAAKPIVSTAPFPVRRNAPSSATKTTINAGAQRGTDRARRRATAMRTRPSRRPPIRRPRRRRSTSTPRSPRRRPPSRRRRRLLRGQIRRRPAGEADEAGDEQADARLAEPLPPPRRSGVSPKAPRTSTIAPPTTSRFEAAPAESPAAASSSAASDRPGSGRAPAR